MVPTFPSLPLVPTLPLLPPGSPGLLMPAGRSAAPWQFSDPKRLGSMGRADKNTGAAVSHPSVSVPLHPLESG